MKRYGILSIILALEVDGEKKGVLGGRIGRMKLYLVRHGETDWNKVKNSGTGGYSAESVWQASGRRDGGGIA